MNPARSLTEAATVVAAEQPVDSAHRHEAAGATNRLSHGSGHIEVRGARTNNLRDVSIDVRKGALTVFTGVSGSGKSSLVLGTIAAESQRLLNETQPTFVQGLLPQTVRPDVDSLRNLSAVVTVDQKRLGADPRSTIGTATDTYGLLRQLFSRHGSPHIGSPSRFSFNDPSGMCPTCSGTGVVTEVDIDQLVDRDLSLNDGALLFPTFAVGTGFWSIFVNSGFFDPDLPLGKYDDQEWERLLHLEHAKTDSRSLKVTYEGLLPKLRRLYLNKERESLQPHVRAAVEQIAITAQCTACEGSRLSEEARSVRVNGVGIAECTGMEIARLLEVVQQWNDPAMAGVVHGIRGALTAMVELGLGYLNLQRRAGTLSGGESQRVKMVRHLGSALTDLTYVFDEPTTGLHADDVDRVLKVMASLRDKGNTVLVVEHDPQVLDVADAVVDLGPGAGTHGGTIVYAGPPSGLPASDGPTAASLRTVPQLRTAREPRGWLRVENADLHNLRDITVEIPLGVFVAVSGVAGAGKSSLARGVLPSRLDSCVIIDQSLPRGSRRSTPASWTGILDPIRKAFARATGVSAAQFSSNSAGACPACNGLGVVVTELGRGDTVESPCEECEGTRFRSEVLAHRLRDRSIADVLAMSISEACAFFTEPAIREVLASLEGAGLGYLGLGQPLSTLSGGERQRLKLAVELASPSDFYVVDEPTAGLHRQDVGRLLGLLDQLVMKGSTVVVVEHDLDVIAQADWVIDMGPGAGAAGGDIVFAGLPEDLMESRPSVTGRHLASRVRGEGAGHPGA
ncbi:ATP-binding cassette domain-containing protein [Streptomyces sp. NPDC091273]|uniref:ATP-binding cassette domain-containing protein n=1 Tax=Streptomyces sp. NPDC091273 TaxID=3365982 RepID=UPI003824E872